MGKTAHLGWDGTLTFHLCHPWHVGCHIRYGKQYQLSGRPCLSLTWIGNGGFFRRTSCQHKALIKKGFHTNSLRAATPTVQPLASGCSPKPLTTGAMSHPIDGISCARSLLPHRRLETSHVSRLGLQDVNFQRSKGRIHCLVAGDVSFTFANDLQLTGSQCFTINFRQLGHLKPPHRQSRCWAISISRKDSRSYSRLSFWQCGLG